METKHELPEFNYPAVLINNAASAGVNFAREPVLRRMPDGSLFCTFLTGGDGEPRNENYAAATRSFDDGETWTKLAPLFNHENRGFWPTELFTGGQQPCLFVHSYNAAGDYLGHPYHEIIAYRSWTADSGATWSPLKKVPLGLANVSVRQGIVLSNGEWLFPVYWLDLAEGTPDSVLRSGAYVSADQGQSFQTYGYACPGGESAAPQNRLWEPNCVEAEPGHVIMLMRASFAGWLYRTDSFDYGRTWSPPAATDIPSPSTKISLAKIDGNIILANNPKPDGWDNRIDLSLWVSGDGMKTWKTKLPLSKDPDLHMFYPHMYCDDSRQTLYLTCENCQQSYLLKIPYGKLI